MECIRVTSIFNQNSLDVFRCRDYFRHSGRNRNVFAIGCFRIDTIHMIWKVNFTVGNMIFRESLTRKKQFESIFKYQSFRQIYFTQMWFNEQQLMVSLFQHVQRNILVLFCVLNVTHLFFDRIQTISSFLWK